MTIQIHHMTALDLLRTLDDNSVDSVVSDPPSGINFMSKSWDRHDSYKAQTDKGHDVSAQLGALLRPWEVGFCAFIADVFSEALRVIKPGGHGLIWALPRTSDLTALGLRAAGWEIRDSVHHLFGSGFPKSADISKAIDKAAGAERKVVGKNPNHRPMTACGVNYEGTYSGSNTGAQTITAPATPEAQRWSGWGTALKPGHETWWLIRKPISGTIAGNVQEWGTGALNVDACRVATSESPEDIYNGQTGPIGGSAAYGGTDKTIHATGHTGGRWPPNVLLTHSAGCKRAGMKQVRGSAPASGPTLTGKRSDTPAGLLRRAHGVKSTPPSYQVETVQAWDCEEGCPVKEVGEQSGESVAVQNRVSDGRINTGASIFIDGRRTPTNSHDDKGTAARFYPQFQYVAKPSRAEREAGLDHLTSSQRDETRTAGDPGGDNPRNRGAAQVKNTHPTVKSVELMRWLTRLITRPGGLVLDPFVGSGTTALACVHEGFDFVGSEQSEEYVEIARARVDYADPAGGQTRRSARGEAGLQLNDDGQWRLF